jgi:transcription antitermination factor NusG
MSTLAIQASDLAVMTALPTAFLQPNWYAAQIGVNQEKQVAGRLQEKRIESFLPLYQEVRRRTDRRVVLEMPLFPGYVFVRIALRDRLKVLVDPRVVRLVGLGPTPVAIPDRDIDSLRAGLAHGQAMPHPYLQVGRRVRLVAGPFEGVEGVLIRRKSSLRIVVSIDTILRSFTVEVDESEVESIGGNSIPPR